MTQTVTLTSGAVATLRDVADITERQRRPIKRIQSKLAALPTFVAAVQEAEAAQKVSGGSLTTEQQLSIAAGMGEAFDLLESLNDFLIVAVVRGWTYEFPVDVDRVQDLPTKDVDQLREVCAPFLKELMPNFEPTTDAASPTEPSAA
ncbi:MULTISPECIES: hypothetical protein [unclassified Kitasatospora]|uniref:hypothetical protein n=1 Tax=unclassified Kitasatospora TaxID=2633591 RepID=UPI002476186A|nr:MULTISPECIES: hypothetical protein [unclassified Kitasatospora]MDH6123860.1 hypothetical protein [Kitasatospora sp. GP82]MDH6576041.1 hypothetical protein [Kitasatospora sp. MAP5-34]